MPSPDRASRTGSSRRRGGRAAGRLLLGALLALAVVGAAALVFTDDARWLRLGIVAALWAALVGAFAAARYRREVAADHDRSEELRRVYELELEREVAARREYELEVETDTRRRVEGEVRDEVRGELDGVRTELRTLRQNLEALLGGEVLVERVALRAESTRLRSLSDQSRAARSALPAGSGDQRWRGDTGQFDAEILAGHLDAMPRQPSTDRGRAGAGAGAGQSAAERGRPGSDPSRTGPHSFDTSRTAVFDASRTGAHPTDVSRTGGQPFDPMRTGAHPVDPSRTGAHPVDPTRTGAQAYDPSRTGQHPFDALRTGQQRAIQARNGQQGVEGRPQQPAARPAAPDPTDILPRYQGVAQPEPSRPGAEQPPWSALYSPSGQQPATPKVEQRPTAATNGGHRRAPEPEQPGYTGRRRKADDEPAKGRRRRSEGAAEQDTAKPDADRGQRAGEPDSGRRRRPDEDTGGRSAEELLASMNDAARSGRRHRRDGG